MNNRYLLFTLFLFLTGFLRAQEVCHRTTVFFDTDKFALTAASIQKLDSLVGVIGNSEYMIELYGHIDTVGDFDHNQK